MFSYFSEVKVTEWPPIRKIAAHSAYEMFSWYKYFIVSLFFFPPWFLEWESFSDCAFSCSLPTCTLLFVLTLFGQRRRLVCAYNSIYF